MTQDNFNALNKRPATRRPLVPVELGTIRIGEEVAGELHQFDEFRITELYRAGGSWARHKLDGELRSAGAGQEPAKLRVIPIQAQFDAPDLVVRTQLQAFDAESRRVVCVARREGKAVREGAPGHLEDVACDGPVACEFASMPSVTCKEICRAHVQIAGQEDYDNGFVLRTAGLNSSQTLLAKFRRFHALLGGRLLGVPFELVLRQKSSEASEGRPFWFVDVRLASGTSHADAKKLAEERAKEWRDAGLDRGAFEDEVRFGLENVSRLIDDPGEAAMTAEFYGVMVPRDDVAKAFPQRPAGRDSQKPAFIAEGFSLGANRDGCDPAPQTARLAEVRDLRPSQDTGRSPSIAEATPVSIPHARSVGAPKVHVHQPAAPIHRDPMAVDY